ncbi:hypothetical protein PENTCL1PPCAC_25136, partial [Pristionchus entomophagus]
QVRLYGRARQRRSRRRIRIRLRGVRLGPAFCRQRRLRIRSRRRRIVEPTRRDQASHRPVVLHGS